MRVSDDVLRVLSAAEVDGNRLVLTGQLDRKLYEATNKVLAAAGGVWTRKVKAHVFPEDAADLVDRVILTGEIDIPKDEFGFFPSPPEVVAVLMGKARIESHHLVLEPSAGHGAIALEAAKIVGTEDVECVEVLPANATVLCSMGFATITGDFLAVQLTRRYDRIVMNPPFVKQADIKHVTRALEWLKPDGLLVSVMSAGVAFRADRMTTQFRALVDERGGTIEPLPDGSFKASGTGVRTVVVTIPGGGK